jgi:hypothetical protein
MELQLTAEERKLLAEILGQHQRALLLEIAHADHLQFKIELRDRERMLESLLQKLDNAQIAA